MSKAKVIKVRKLSLFRVFIALVAIISLGYFAFIKAEEIKYEVETINVEYDPWFASYVDVTSKPKFAFEQLGSTPTPQTVLSFIVAAESDLCLPTWGTYYTMDQAAEKLDLDRRIARLQQQDGRVAISFGGAINNELGFVCKDEQKLYEAYKSVVERYNIDTIDLDLEYASLADLDSAKTRARAIARLQKERRDEGKSLAVWLTLPVTPQGLTPQGTDQVLVMLENEVDLAGVNVMTMNYGGSKARGDSMYEASKSALIETQRQLGILYDRVGIYLNSKSLWGKIGATPMIGQNDVYDEVFTIEDAELLNEFTRQKEIGRMSMWSVNRDVPCGENYVDTKVVSDSCSGVTTERFGFSLALSNGFDGDLAQNSTLLTKSDSKSNQAVVDDPENSPYQIWRENGTYSRGVKVVWHGNVYEAKWWSKNDVPDNPVLQQWETPWQLVGPVLPDEKPIEQPKLPEGTYPNWSGTVEYEGGDLVLFEGIPFEAKWWNQGESPAESSFNADASPWIPLSQQEIEKILNELAK